MSNFAKYFVRITVTALIFIILICSCLLFDLNGYSIGGLAYATGDSALSESSSSDITIGKTITELYFNTDILPSLSDYSSNLGAISYYSMFTFTYYVIFSSDASVADNIGKTLDVPPALSNCIYIATDTISKTFSLVYRPTASLSDDIYIYSSSGWSLSKLTLSSPITVNFMQGYDKLRYIMSPNSSFFSPDVTELNNQILSLQSDLSVITNKYNALLSEKTSLNNRIQSLSSEITGLQNQVSALTVDKTNLQNQIKDLSSRITSLENDLTSKQSVIDSLTSNKTELEIQVTSLNNRISVLNGELSSKQSTIDSLTSDKSELENRVSSYEASILEKDKKINDLQAELNLYKSRDNGYNFSTRYCTPKRLAFNRYYINMSVDPVVPYGLLFNKTVDKYRICELFSKVNTGDFTFISNSADTLAWLIRPYWELDPTSVRPGEIIYTGYDFYLITNGFADTRTASNVLFWGYVSASEYDKQFIDGAGISHWEDSGWNIAPTITVDNLNIFVSSPITDTNYINDLDSSLSCQFGTFGWSSYVAGFDVQNWESREVDDHYNSGYYEGYKDGSEYQKQESYDNGYSVGYNSGYYVGKAAGINIGISQNENYNFLSLIGAVIDAPIQALFGGRSVTLNSGTKVKLSNGDFYTLTKDTVAKTTGLFNFSVLGVDMSSLVLSLFTLAIIFTVLKLVIDRN